jgi:hypothetical protein
LPPAFKIIDPHPGQVPDSIPEQLASDGKRQEIAGFFVGRNGRRYQVDVIEAKLLTHLQGQAKMRNVRRIKGSPQNTDGLHMLVPNDCRKKTRAIILLRALDARCYMPWA